MIQFLFIGTSELLLISGIALLLFGGKKLPEMMRGLGQGVKPFKEGMQDIDPTETPEKEEKCETMGTGKEDKTQKEIQNDENIQKQERK